VAVRPMRVDAQRNYDRILAVAESVVAQQGADASLEEIARRAGVGSATLHRHFPTRHALLEAVFRDRTEVLCAKARELAAGAEPGVALVTWLREVGAYVVANRGLATSLIRRDRAPGSAPGPSCHQVVSDAGDELLDLAREAGTVRPDVSIVDLLMLVNALSLAAEQVPDGAAEVDRLITLAIGGIH
jgi:AcrR family transcriptional regulator